MKKTIGLCVAGLVLTAALCQAQPALDPAALGMTLTKMERGEAKSVALALGPGDLRRIQGLPHVRSRPGRGHRLDGGAHDGRLLQRLHGHEEHQVRGHARGLDGLPDQAGREGAGRLRRLALEKAAGTAVDNLDDYNADSFLSDAMAFRPIVLMAGEMIKNPALKEKYGAKGESYLKFAEQIYAKWVERGGWRETKGGGMISVTLPYGMDQTNTEVDRFRHPERARPRILAPGQQGQRGRPLDARDVGRDGQAGIQGARGEMVQAA